MSEAIQCDKCGRIVPENEHGVCLANHFHLEILKDGYWWCNYHGHFCQSCTEEFKKWLGDKE